MQGDLFGGWLETTSKLPAGCVGGAKFSPCGKYRYELTREWSDGEGDALFIMCNPSDADVLRNDRTVTRVSSFARAAGLRRFTVANMQAFITPYPADMLKALQAGVDIVGPDNDATIARLAATASIVVMACGSARSHAGIARLMRGRARALCFGDGPLAKRELHALRVTKEGAPEHPLYLPGACTPQPYSRADLERWCGKAT